ncbi:MAG: hypothetical protein U5K56_17450 [Halioglobus sp.]|nr:hypothetical protein [Halioglobus sp.]
MKKSRIFLATLLCAVIVIFAYRSWVDSSRAASGLVEVANGDAQFWLMQGPPNNQYSLAPFTIEFDAPLDEALLRDRLDELASAYQMFNRNIVEIGGLPYWQSVAVDWRENFRVLDAGESRLIRRQAELRRIQAARLDEGLTSFRAFLTPDRKQLVFVWHHVISDFEGMFNKHAKHLFNVTGARTQFGYQIHTTNTPGDAKRSANPPVNLSDVFNRPARPLGFTDADYLVTKVTLPIDDQSLHLSGKRAALPMSDIFSFIALRTATRYKDLAKEEDANSAPMRPLLSPISLRSSALDMDEGNNRAVKHFPFVLPLEDVSQMHQRITSLESTSGSYDQAGKLMKLARRAVFLEPWLRSVSMPDYISNYFPLADMPLAIGGSQLVAHNLRVPMVPYEQVKFAWSNYNGQVQLYLHTDPLLVDMELMLKAFEQASQEVLMYLHEFSQIAGSDPSAT